MNFILDNIKWFMVFIAILTEGCGQTGPLYVPEPNVGELAMFQYFK